MAQESPTTCYLLLVPCYSLFDLPDVALAEEFVDVVLLAADGLGELLFEESVVGGALDGAKDADRYRVVRVVHAREHESDCGSSMVSSWTRTSFSVMPSLPSSTTSGLRPLMRMPLSEFLPKIIGSPCFRKSMRSARTSFAVKSSKAPSL